MYRGRSREREKYWWVRCILAMFWAKRSSSGELGPPFLASPCLAEVEAKKLASYGFPILRQQRTLRVQVLKYDLFAQNHTYDS